jgi:DNA-binding phage protein
MHSTFNNTARHARKKNFLIDAKLALVARGESIADLARALKVHRNSIYLALTTHTCPRVRERIRARLGLAA